MSAYCLLNELLARPRHTHTYTATELLQIYTIGHMGQHRDYSGLLYESGNVQQIDGEWSKLLVAVGEFVANKTV